MEESGARVEPLFSCGFVSHMKGAMEHPILKEGKRNLMVQRVILTIALSVLSVVFEPVFAHCGKLPFIGGKETVAIVNDEAITRKEFERAMKAVHEGGAEEEGPTETDPSKVLNRLIAVNLIVQEAKNIGLDELPQVLEMVDAYKKRMLRELLFERQLRNVRVSDAEVEKRYKASVREVKLKSILIENEEDSKTVLKDLESGVNFDNVIGKMIAEGKATGSEAGEYVRIKDLLPSIAEILSKMTVGQRSPMVKLGTKFTIFKLEDVRYAEDPQARQQAREEELREKRLKALKRYANSLKKTYVKVDQKLLKKIDFESKEPGFDKLLQDKRVVANVKGVGPVTVGELAETIKKRFYHGTESAVESKKVNELKEKTLEEILLKKIFRKEALAHKIHKTERYRDLVDEYQKSVIFGAFVQKVVDPDIRIEESELREYYRDHRADYSSPEMMRIHGLIFAARDAAERAFALLQQGADYAWIKANADGQVGETGTESLLQFRGSVLNTTSLPTAVREAVQGAEPGSYRFMPDEAGHYYILYIEELFPSKPKDLEEVKDEIAAAVFRKKRKQAVEEWAGKLRALSDVEIFATDIGSEAGRRQ